MPLFNRKMIGFTNFIYWIYTSVFSCRRTVINALFQEDQPRKKFEIEIPRPSFPWVYVAAIEEDDIEVDVTTLVETAVKPGEILTPDKLSEITGIKNAIRWEFLNVSTFEVETISSDGLVNEVKWKAN
jgi:hypothetical protein